jgi:transposase
MYQRLLARAGRHLLIGVKAVVCFEAIEAGCAGYFHAGGRGRPASYTVGQMSRLLFLKYLYHRSYRESAEEVKYNWLWRWFCGFHLFEETPDHTRLFDFEAWVCREQPTLYFDELLRQIDRLLPEERQQPQVGDTYAHLANAARESLIGLLRHSSRCLLRAVEKANPVVYRQVYAQLDRAVLWGEGEEIPTWRLTESQQTERACAVARAVIDCCLRVCVALAQQQGRPVTTQPEVAQWGQRVSKMLTDEFVITWGAFFQPVAIRLCSDKERGAYRLGSATDPEATYRKHHDRTDLGYNVSLAATPTGFIRDIRADTGAQPDSVAIPLLVSAQADRHGFVPPKLIYDRAGGTGKKVAEVAEVSGGQTRLVARMVEYQKREDRFSPADFTLNPDGSLTCPGGFTSHTAYASPHGDGLTFRFPASTCATCPFLLPCRGAKVAPARYRQVFISHYRRPYLEALAYSRTDQFKADMKLRPGIEPLISDLVNHHDGRHARARGQLKADFHVKMCAMALNTTRFIARLRQKEVHAVYSPPELVLPTR